MPSTFHTIRLAAVYFCVLLVLLFVVAWPGYTNFLAERRAVVVSSTQGHLALFAQHVDQELFTAGAQVRMLSLLQLTRQVIGSVPENQQARSELGTHFLRIVSNFQIYSQLRVLDSTGQEMIRVNRVGERAVRVPENELQFKGNTDYFQAAMTLGPRQLFFSRVDLNEENGRIQDPLIPTLRIASQITEQDGKVLGIVVASLDVQGLFKWANDLFHTEQHAIQFSLLNQDGYWFSSEQPGQAWGWLLGRSDQNLGRQNATLWQAASSLGDAEIDASNGVYVADTHYPMRAFAGARFNAATLQVGGNGNGALTEDTSHLRWVALVFIPESAWLNGTLLQQRWTQGVIVLLVVLLAAGSGFVARQQLLRRWIRDTERAHANELSELYEQAPCGYQSVDAGGIYLRINDTALGWTGYQRNEVVGKLHYSKVLLPDPTGRVLDNPQTHLERIREEGSLVDFPMLMRRKDGTTFPVSLSARAVYSQHGDFVMTRTTIADMTERRALEAQLREQAFTDPLTGAVNRRHFTLLALQELKQISRAGRPCALMALDIDHFKRVNDTYGHAVGDLALKAFTQACQGAVRAGDIVARMGGEEFAILLPAAAPHVGEHVAERVRLAVQAIALPMEGGDTLKFTVSIGLVFIDADHADLENALARADQLLYQAKANGRNRVEISC